MGWFGDLFSKKKDIEEEPQVNTNEAILAEMAQVKEKVSHLYATLELERKFLQKRLGSLNPNPAFKRLIDSDQRILVDAESIFSQHNSAAMNLLAEIENIVGVRDAFSPICNRIREHLVAVSDLLHNLVTKKDSSELISLLSRNVTLAVNHLDQAIGEVHKMERVVDVEKEIGVTPPGMRGYKKGSDLSGSAVEILEKEVQYIINTLYESGDFLEDALSKLEEVGKKSNLSGLMERIRDNWTLMFEKLDRRFIMPLHGAANDLLNARSKIVEMTQRITSRQYDSGPRLRINLER